MESHRMDRAIAAQIWGEVLGREDIKDSDTFFELGGDSVLALTLTFRLEEALGQPVEVFEIFDHPRFGDFLARMNCLAGA